MNDAIDWLKKQKLKGAITGSCMLDYFEGSDVDWFAYDEKSFTQMFYAMYYDKMFTMLDPIERWKANKFMENNDKRPFGILTLKFMWNTCLPVNIILKKGCTNVFDIISSFDMDIVCKAYDTNTQQLLDLTNNSTQTKTADWNRWNTAFYDPEIWEMSRILRQFDRIVKYHKRGYNTDNVALKYIELIDNIQEYQNIFNSDNFTEKLKITKENTKIMKQILEKWLESHEISDEELELVKIKLKDI